LEIRDWGLGCGTLLPVTSLQSLSFMDETRLSLLLQNVSEGTLSVESALTQLRGLPYETVGDFATLDHHRALRNGFPETIYCESKTPEQVAAIAERLAARSF
jgi:NCAIR mutase (PurE)-related protein